MLRYDKQIINQVGAPISGASVQVNISGGGAATIYSDDGITPTGNPLTTDSNGRFFFYAADGHYDLIISGANITTFTLSSQEIADITGNASLSADATWRAPNITLAGVINKITITQPANGSTLTIADGKTLIVNNSLTLAGTDGTTQTFQASDTIVGRATTDTLTNKRITIRAVGVADGTSITPNGDTTDLVSQLNTQVAGTLTINAPTGTPTDGQKLLFRIRSTNVQTFSWNATYKGSTTSPLPTATTGTSKTDYIGMMWNAVNSEWDCVAVDMGH